MILLQPSVETAGQTVATYYWNGASRDTIRVDLGQIAIRPQPGMRGLVEDAFHPFLGTEPTLRKEYREQRISIYAIPSEASHGFEAVYDTLIKTPSVDVAGVVVLQPESEGSMVLTNKIIVWFKGSADSELAAQETLIRSFNLAEVGAERVRPTRAILVLEGGSPIDALRIANELKELHGDVVEYAYPSFIIPTESQQSSEGLNDPCLEQQWHLFTTRTVAAWAETKGTQDVVIAIIDKGFDVSHPDLKPNLRIPLGAKVDIVGKDRNPSVSTADDSHGTKSAGIAVAKGNNSIGIAGGCPECGFLPIRAVGGDIDFLGEAFLRASDWGARVISNSWSFNAGFATPWELRLAIDDAVENDIVVVFATPGRDIANDISGLPNVIAVGGSTREDKLSSGSGSGDELDILAPSVSIATTAAAGTGCPTSEGSASPGYDFNWHGCSAAAPLVASVAGLILCVRPELTATDVRQILISSAVRIDSLAANYVDGHSQTHGYGRVDARAALEAALAWETIVTRDR
jgi:subtilisin family serine protease